MLPAAIIAKKRDGQILTDAEIRFMIDGMVDGTVPDYQISAWAMAIYFQGMTPEETATLTRAMLASGGRLPRISDALRVDKHSTGGLGDKVSLVLAPLLACMELEVPMLSGRGLGITGGTLDKLESYPNFNCNLTESEINAVLRRVGCVITGTTADIAPADKKLYALRDVTGTVPSIPLITASILCKKLAESLDALVLDVKFGSGAFMQTLGAARELAESLRRTAAELKLPTRVVLSSMQQPLGHLVGNACEANEAVEVLQGAGPEDVRELVLRLGAEVAAAATATPPAQARRALEDHIGSGRAYQRYIAMIEAQGGTFLSRLETAASHDVPSPSDGWVAAIDGTAIGNTIIAMGGGRRKLGDRLDHRVGIQFLSKIGDPVVAGQPLARVLCDDAVAAQRAVESVQRAFALSATPVPADRLIVDAE